MARSQWRKRTSKCMPERSPRTFLHAFPRTMLCFAFAVGTPLAFRHYLRSEIPLWLTLPPVILITVVGMLRHAARSGTARRAGTIVSSSLSVLLALSILAGLLMTPYSAYNAWFHTVRSGLPEGSISDLFVLLSALFAAIFSPMVFSVGALWPFFTLGLVVAFLLEVVHQTAFFLALLVLFVGAAYLYLALRRMPVDHRATSLVFPFVAVLVCLACGGIVSVVWQRERIGNSFVNERIYPTLRHYMLVAVPRFPLVYDVPGYGFSLETKRLGEAPLLSRLAILEIEGPPGEIVYLKTAGYDTYDGDSWKISNLYQRARESEKRSLSLQGYSSRRSRDDIVIRPLVATYNRVPFTLDTLSIGFSGQVPGIAMGNAEVGFLLKRPIGSGHIVLHRILDGETPSQPRQRPGNLYLQLPENLPREVERLATQIASNAQSRLTILKTIEQFLAYNYTYDLDPSATASAGDFVYRFLFVDRQGYCVQFATSFVILARLNGIPARYATGFLVHLSPDEGKAEITGLSAHAWPEVWIEDQGWMVWEATSAVNPFYYTQIGDMLFYGLDMELDSFVSAQLEDILDGRITQQMPENPTLEQAEGSAVGSSSRLLLLIPVGLGLLLCGYAIAYLIKVSRPEESFFLHTRRLIRRVRRRGVVDPQQVGWIAWSEDLKRRLPQQQERIAELTHVFLSHTYGDAPFRRTDLSTLRNSAHGILASLPWPD